MDERWPEWRDANRARWDERVPLHVASDFYDVDGFLAGHDPLRPFEVEELGHVAGLDLVHLQCHFGLDTLGWARRGARVWGLDFSEPAVSAARELAGRAGLADRATFVCSDVYDAVEAFGGRTFDVVYTGLGAIGWLADIRRWAEVCAALLAPGGRFYLAEFHPISWVFGDDDLSVAYPYFQGGDPLVLDESGTYADGDASTNHTRSYEWNHPLSTVVQSLLDAGLVVERLSEHDHTLFDRWPFLDRRPDGTRHLPPDVPSLPLMWSLLARAPRAGTTG